MERSQSSALMCLAASLALLSFACGDSATSSPDKCKDEIDCEVDPENADDEGAEDGADDQPSKADAGAKRDAGGSNPLLDAGKSGGSGKLDAQTPSSSADSGSMSSADGGKPASGLDADTGAGPTQTVPPVEDYEQPGPFETTVLTAQGPGGTFTIFRPKALGDNGFKHSPIIFGCGILTTPDWYTKFLSTVASHGFVVIASNSSNVTDSDLMQGLEWILQQNDQAGDYQGKLDVDRAVSMGYSIGGTSAVNVGAHPSVVTTISIHGHNTTPALHGPLLQTTGTNDDIGMPLQQMTYEASQVQTFLATLQNASHFEILGGEQLQGILDAVSGDGGGGRELAPIIAWLRYWIYQDQGAKHFFYGDDCVLCEDPWTNPQRKNWPDE